MKKLSPVLLVLVVVLLSAPAGFAQEKVDNPVYQNWAKFKPGTMVKYAQTSEMMGNKTQSEVAYTLLEVTPEKVVIEMGGSTVIMGNQTEMPKTRIEYPAKADAADPNVKSAINAKTSQSEEEIEVAGGKIRCKVFETTVEQQGSQIKSRFWSSDDVPGTLVKSETTMEKPVQSVTVLALVEKVIK
ncbi:MAG: hypothetical protein GX442_18875 [Candidatus Riflebacteria bacterium]|nr:hypothetical protein [Candidatus Riflebacteria bacterium]